MLGEIRLELHKVLDELRTTARELRPPTLAEFGLEKAIRSYMEDFQEKHPEFKVQVTLEPDSKQLPDNVRLALFRILQHSVSNVLRHADANRVTVNFSLDEDTAALEIIDNGIGFELPASWMELVRQGHFGMAGAAERIEALGGSFTVESSPGGGATVRARIPCGETPAE
jgi:signal transduction histidine kinase